MNAQYSRNTHKAFKGGQNIPKNDLHVFYAVICWAFLNCLLSLVLSALFKPKHIL